MSSFHAIWKHWHVYDARDQRTYGAGDGEPFHYMLDGIGEWIRHSMKLRGLSERRLRAEQLEAGWTNDQLIEHLRGDHDGPDTADEEILGQLRFLGCEAWAPKFIPEAVLAELLAP